nr:MAG TPA: hypothetical protein [Inoviridae sp.]
MNLIDFIAKRNNRHFRTDIVITSHNVYIRNYSYIKYSYLIK